MATLKNIHPGEILKEEFLEPLEISAYRLSKETFIGTAVVVSTFVDFTRLSVYASRFSKVGIEENIVLIACAVTGGITGSYIGLKLLKKVTLEFIQQLVAVLLIVLSIALGAGLI